MRSFLFSHDQEKLCRWSHILCFIYGKNITRQLWSFLNLFFITLIRLLVGAPKSNSTYISDPLPGAVYKCDPLSVTRACNDEILFDSKNGEFYKSFKNASGGVFPHLAIILLKVC